MTELYIPEGSKFVGQTIMQSTVEDKDLNVLTLYRDGKVFPNPRRERVLEAGDKLLCYGKLEAMRDMIPARTQRKRRPKVQELDTAITSTNSH
ncbi:cation:proton antiporter regulatory subunit [Congregibacter sp.]|uniref:cation:proton antiporter regulatory subunit n=1 Tax=Congregibacter sp. TaxID=2744308 RepID=UPI0039E2B2D3